MAPFPDLDPNGMLADQQLPNPSIGGAQETVGLPVGALPPAPMAGGVDELPQAYETPAQDYEDYVFKANEAQQKNYDKWMKSYYNNEVQSVNYNAWANQVRQNNRKAYKTYNKLYKQIYQGDYDVPTNQGFLQQDKHVPH